MNGLLKFSYTARKKNLFLFGKQVDWHRIKKKIDI